MKFTLPFFRPGRDDFEIALFEKSKDIF